MKSWQKFLGVTLILSSGWAQAQIVTNSKMHLLEETNPKTKTVAVTRAPYQWVEYCESKRVTDVAWKNNQQLAFCMDEILTKHTEEITGVECQKITKMMTPDSSTRREYEAKCKENYAYDLCMQNAESNLKERKKCLVAFADSTSVQSCKSEVTKNFSKDFKPELCDTRGAFDKYRSSLGIKAKRTAHGEGTRR